MSNRTVWYALLCIAFLCTSISCKKDKVETPRETKKPSITLSVSSSDAIIDRTNRLKSTSSNTFKVDILSQNDEIVRSYENLQDVPSSIEIEPGEYYIIVYSNNKKAAAFDSPYYFGQSDYFTLGKGEQKSIAVLCNIISAKVTIVYSDNVKAHFSDYSVIVKRQTDSLVFIKDDTRAGYFEPGRLDVYAHFTYTSSDGSTKNKTVTGSIPMAMGRKHHELYIDASREQGNASLNVSVSDSLSKETYTISDKSSPTKMLYQLSQGDILITEILPNPDKIADELGEWFEIFNNTPSIVNINGLYVKAGTKTLSITTDILIEPGQYAFLCKDVQGGEGAITYYGTALSLVNSTGSIQLYNSNQSDATLLSEMNYSSSPTGASLCLDPSKLTFAQAQDPSSWCTATNVFSTGDKGTPGAVNTTCQ